jgi:hypothetical protein
MFRKISVLAILLTGISLGDSQAASLAAHRAIYDLALDPERPGTQVDKARGRIAFQFSGTSCEGYTITLRQVTALDTGEGQETVSDLRNETWENATSTSYRFKTQNYVNEQIREDITGIVTRQKNDALTVRVTKPKPASFTLPGKIYLPTQHTRAMLEAAERGEKLLSANIFDGSPDGRKIYETLTVIGAAELHNEKTPAPYPALAGLKRYPVTTSYFELGRTDRFPAYTLSFDLYENGVSSALVLNYGNFALKGKLQSVELLPQKPCAALPQKR